MMFLGYANKDEGNCYQRFNPYRNSEVETLDVIWLCCVYYEKVNIQVTNVDPIVVIEVDSNRSEMEDTLIETKRLDEQVAEDVLSDDVSVRLEVSIEHRPV